MMGLQNDTAKKNIPLASDICLWLLIKEDIYMYLKYIQIPS